MLAFFASLCHNWHWRDSALAWINLTALESYYHSSLDKTVAPVLDRTWTRICNIAQYLQQVSFRRNSSFFDRSEQDWSSYSPDSEMTTLTQACWRMIVKSFLSADKITRRALQCWGAQGNRQLGKRWSCHDTPSVQWYRKHRVYLKRKPFIKKTADPKFVTTYLER